VRGEEFRTIEDQRRPFRRPGTPVLRSKTYFEQLLEQVAGDPDDLTRGAERCLAASTDVLGIAAQQASDRARLQPPAWGGEAADAFQTGLTNVEESIRQLGDGLAAAKEVLVEAAKLRKLNLSGKGGAVLDTVVGGQDIRDGQKDRNDATDGTYRDDIGPYTRSVQDLIDSVG
jgi:uncharacterized protein YukE